ncbi:MAG TPA: hypothetical protein VFU29_13885 [Chitinophagaceae bacterium]|nr:hypothetical protein [Chitinophagaceae bacterium]
MNTPKFSILILLLTLAACGQKSNETKKHIVNAKAKQLNDSAMTLIRYMKDDSSQKAILLLDEAIKIDSNYFIAYWNKLSLQSQLKQYDKAIATGKEILKLNKSPYYNFLIATFYYRLGDTTSANNYFKKTLTMCDTVLDTMSTKNKATYEVVVMNKGVSLIFLGHEEEGNKILKQFYDNQTDTAYRVWTGAFMNKTKEEILKVLDGEN